MTAPEWFAHCVELCRHGEPMTPADEAVQRSLCAAEMARAEARRQQPSPQMELTP